MMKAENIGSSFDDFLQEEGILDEANAVAIKRVIAWQIDQEMKAQQLTAFGGTVLIDEGEQ
jgi:antitoxin HicB